MYPRVILPTMMILAMICPAGSAQATWPNDGLPIAIAPCEEIAVSAAPDGAGGFILVWADRRNCFDTDLFAQRITGAGTIAAGWDSVGVAICTLPGEQAYASAVPDGQGGAVVVWRDSRSSVSKLYAQRIDTAGARLWTANGVPLCLAAGGQGGFRVVPDREGGAVVCWSDGRYGLTDGPPRYHSLSNLFAQHIRPDGTRAWSDSAAAVCTDSLGQGSPSVLTDGDDGYLIAWYDGRGSAYLQHLDAMGDPLLSENGIAVPGRFLGIAGPDGTGGILSAFTSGPDGSDDVFIQRVASDGSLRWQLNGVQLTNAVYDQRASSLLPDGAGGGYVAWHDLRNGKDWDVYVQRFNADGKLAEGWPENGLPVCTSSGNQIYPVLIYDDAGGCVVLWYDSRDPMNEYDIYAQRLTPAGAPVTGWPTGGAPLCRASGNQITPFGVPDGSGGVLVSWGDYRWYADVYVQRVSGAGVVGDTTTATVLHALGAEVTLDSIRVSWRRGASSLFKATVVRSVDGGPRQSIGDVRPDPSGILVFVDREIAPGQTYIYELEVGPTPRIFGRVTARVPPAFPFMLRGVAPNPVATREIAVTFSVPTREPVTLEILDLQGRREARLRFTPTSLLPTTRVLPLGDTVRSGLHFVRMTQSGKSVVRKLSVVR